MLPLSHLDVECELSYAYLHAVASRCGFACEQTGRHSDNAGVDARITAWGPFPGAYLHEVDVNVQLKATIKTPPDDGTYFSYFLSGVQRYNDLRATSLATPRLLVVLFLPDNSNDWLGHDADQLVLKRCAYWQSLHGAPTTQNHDGATVYLPKAQYFGPNVLRDLMIRFAKRDVPTYSHP